VYVRPWAWGARRRVWGEKRDHPTLPERAEGMWQEGVGGLLLAVAQESGLLETLERACPGPSSSRPSALLGTLLFLSAVGLRRT
jgi:hypothetical protein